MLHVQFVITYGITCLSIVFSDGNEYSNMYSPQDFQDYEENYLSSGHTFSPPDPSIGKTILTFTVLFFNTQCITNYLDCLLVY